MSHPFISSLKNKATNFPTLAGLIIPCPTIEASNQNKGRMAPVPFRLYRLRGFVTYCSSLVNHTSPSNGYDFYMTLIEDEMDSGAVTFATHTCIVGRVGIHAVGEQRGMYEIGGAAYTQYTNGSAYTITLNEGHPDVFSTSLEETRLPEGNRGVVPYLTTTNVGTDDSVTLHWYVVIDALGEF